jgi:cytochrome b561
MSINFDIIEENVIFNVKTKVTVYKRGRKQMRRFASDFVFLVLQVLVLRCKLFGIMRASLKSQNALFLLQSKGQRPEIAKPIPSYALGIM